MKQSREEILQINPVFTQFILDMQLSYKPEPYEEGESVILDSSDENGTVLTKKMSDKLNEEQLLLFEKNRDKNPFIVSAKSDFIESRLIISSKQRTSDYLNDLATALENIRIGLSESDLIILGVQNIPWLTQNNEYPPAKRALDYLKEKFDEGFDGGLLLNKKNLNEFVPHLFWLIRCNASLPYFFMSFPNSKSIISVCKYGVLHIDFYDQSEKIDILRILSDMGFKEVDNCGDPVEFDSFDGRKIKLRS